MKFLFTLYGLVFKIDKILILESHFPSGSNTEIIRRNLESQSIDYEIMSWKSFSEYRGIKKKIELIKYHSKIARYKIVLNTNGYHKYNLNQIVVDYWHGTPLKKMGYMQEFFLKSGIYNCDYLIANSNFEASLLAACMQIPIERIKVLGSPRIDYLKSENQIALRRLIECNCVDDDTRIILYMPTFRDVSKANEMFYFDQFDADKFNQFLEDHNLFLVIKKHPRDTMNFSNSNRIFDFDNSKLESDNLDFYQVLGSVDLLITDYSSIMFDFYLTRKPMILLNNDFEEYVSERGLLFNDYTTLLNSDPVENQHDLQKKICDIIDSNTNEKCSNSIFHDYTDFKNVDRNINFINELRGK